MNIGEILLKAIKEAGAKTLFGIPGDYVLPFFEVIEKSRILPLYTLSHEPAVGYAADAAARYGGGIGVAVVTYGAGALNMINAVACAWAERSPLVIISGAPGTNELDRGLLLHHQTRSTKSQLRIFRELTCARTVLSDPATAPKEIARVLRACKRHSRPVYIELPRDIVNAESRPVPNLRHNARNDKAVRLCNEAIIEKVTQARQPVILADAEVRRFGLEGAVEAMARRTGIPLITTLMGRGLFADPESICRGTYLGAAGDETISDLIENSDCLIMLGVIASDTNLGPSSRKIELSRAIRINGDNVFIDGKTFNHVNMAQLVGLLQNQMPLKAGKESPVIPMPLARDRDNDLQADDIAVLVNKELQHFPKMPVAVDMGDCLFISMGLRNVPILAPGYYATMGFGVPAGIGIQAATGERPLIIVGDGGFQMTGWELLNCAGNGFDPIVVVLNNGGWGMLKHFQPSACYTARNGTSYAALAEVLGGEGYTATTGRDMAAALHKAFHKRGKFQLIEAVLPKDNTSTMLRRYVDVLKSKVAAGA